MEELETVLRLHARRYRVMEPTDAVKLVYQNTFVGGHLIRDEAGCLEYLRREYAATPRDPEVPEWEDIGGGLGRVSLAAVAPEDLEALGQAFLRSARLHTGSRDRFLEKLALLERLTEEGLFSFSREALEAYLSGYARAGYPAVSHSGAYRAAYHPAYRVVLAREWKAAAPGKSPGGACGGGPVVL